MISEKQKEDLCMTFLGSCSTISNWYLKYYNISEQELAEILEEGEIFCCENCNWWAEFSEMTINEVGERLCYDCSRDEENG